jgi:hypothetical protein
VFPATQLDVPKSVEMRSAISSSNDGGRRDRARVLRMHGDPRVPDFEDRFAAFGCEHVGCAPRETSDESVPSWTSSSMGATAIVDHSSPVPNAAPTRE